MNREELIKALKDWKPELELMAKYNDNSIDYQRYRALDETIKMLEQIPDLKEAYNKGYKDGQDALALHLELCKDEGSIITVPEGATNGDMIKALFPNEVGYGESVSCIYYGTMRFDSDWWDSPYRKEQK